MTERARHSWLPLVDEPIAAIVGRIEASHPEFVRQLRSPQQLLAFRTFATIRVGLVLGELLVEHDLAPYDGTENWVETLLRDQEHSARIVAEVQTVASEIESERRFESPHPTRLQEEVLERVRAHASRLPAPS